MKNMIESVKNYWKGFVKLFKDTPESYYYKMDGKQDPIKVPVDEKCCSGTDCVCKDTSDYTYEESVADELLDPVPEAPAPAIKSVSKADLSKMSKLELQVMAQNAGVILTGKEKKQQLVSKLAKHLAL